MFNWLLYWLLFSVNSVLDTFITCGLLLLLFLTLVISILSVEVLSVDQLPMFGQRLKSLLFNNLASFWLVPQLTVICCRVYHTCLLMCSQFLSHRMNSPIPLSIKVSHFKKTKLTWNILLKNVLWDHIWSKHQFTSTSISWLPVTN